MISVVISLHHKNITWSFIADQYLYVLLIDIRNVNGRIMSFGDLFLRLFYRLNRVDQSNCHISRQLIFAMQQFHGI